MSAHNHMALADPAAEIALLGSASRGGAEVLSGMVGTVGEDWFYSAAHQLGWRVLSGLIARGLPMDFVVIENEFIGAGMDRKVATQLCESISRAVPTSRNWPHYVDVLDKWRTRRMGVALARTMAEGFANLEMEPKKLVGELEAGLYELQSNRSRCVAKHRGDAIDRVIMDLREAFGKRGHVIGGLGTGYTDVDRLAIKGGRPGHVWVIGAPPGGGKTLLLSKVLENLAMGRGDYLEFKQEGVPVLLVSLEMDDYELAERDVVRGSRVSLAQIQQGMVKREIVDNMPVTLRKQRDAPFYILHVPGKSWEQIRILVKFECVRLGIKVVGFDYIQAAHSDAKDAKGNRTREMQIISIGIDQMAADTQTWWIIGSQLIRESFRNSGATAKKEPPRPGIADLRESAQIAQDADFVGILNEWWEPPAPDDDNVKKKDTSRAAAGDADESEEWEDTADNAPFGDFIGLDVVKNRHGGKTDRKPMIKLEWAKAYFDFVSTNNRLFDPTGKQHQQH